MESIQADDAMQTPKSRFRYWSFYPLLIVLMFTAVAVLVHGLNERQKLTNERVIWGETRLPAILEIVQLQKWLEGWMSSMYQYQAFGKRDVYFRQSSYYLEKITEQMESLKKKGIGATELNDFHKHIQNISLSVTSFEKAMEDDKRPSDLTRKILLSMQQDVGQSQLQFKRWGEKTAQSFQAQTLVINDYFNSLILWQLIFALFTFIVSAYLLIRLMFRWVSDKRLIYQIYNQDDLDVPNIRQLTHDFKNLVIDKQVSNAAIMRLNIYGQAELSRLFGKHASQLAQKVIAQRLSNSTKKLTPKARLYFVAEQQWVILLLLDDLDDDAGEKKANELASLLLEQIEKTVELKNMTLSFSAKIAFSFYPKHATTCYLCVQQAEMAMLLLSDLPTKRIKSIYKSNSINSDDQRVTFYHQDIDVKVKQRINLVGHLRHVLLQSGSSGFDKFRLRYQPAMPSDPSNKNNEWFIHSTLQWVADTKVMELSSFSELAERSGLIIELGYWYLEKAFYQWQEWQLKWKHKGISPRAIVISTTPRQLTDRGYPKELSRLLSAYHVPPQNVILSLSGSWKGLLPSERSESFAAVQAIGVRLMLADFGFSDISIAEFIEFPVEGILIHKDFISRIKDDYAPAKLLNSDISKMSSSLAVVHLMMSMSKSLRRWILADGVTSIEQNAILSSLGCQYIQGQINTKLMDEQEFYQWAIKYVEK